jgi:UDP-N-acetylmuramate dehydrogenase
MKKYPLQLLSQHTTFKIGGPADLVLIPENAEEFKEAVQTSANYFILGGGSNLLVSDEGFRGTVIKTSLLKKIEQKENTVIAEAGVSLGQLFDFAQGVPVSLGGGLQNNFGAFDHSLADHVVSVIILDEQGEQKVLPRNELEFSYRKSNLAGKVIYAAELKDLPPKSTKYLKKRQTKQPLSLPCAGSVFKNPAPDKPAGMLIDLSGCKGMKVGKAVVWDKHGNFIVNEGGAKAVDVMKLINDIQEKVLEKFGIKLELEIELIGFPHP